MLKIGLTGGIGSGKSVVADRFRALGVPVIDADDIAHRMVEPGLPAYKEIIDTFGEQIMNASKGIDRAHLRARVFDSGADRKRLEAILHPRIRKEIRKRVGQLNAPYLVLVIPLLVETGQQGLVDRVLVIDTDDTKRIARLKTRDGLSENEIRKIMAAQLDQETRLQAADDCIRNEGTIDDLVGEVDRLHQYYLSLADATEQ